MEGKELVGSQDEEEGKASDVEVSLSPALLKVALDLCAQLEVGCIGKVLTVLHHRTDGI